MTAVMARSGLSRLALATWTGWCADTVGRHV